MSTRTLVFAVITLLLVALTFLLSVALLPPPPMAPTPTWPLGIDLPDQLPRIPH